MARKTPDRIRAIEEALGPELRSEAWQRKSPGIKLTWLVTKHRHASPDDERTAEAARQLISTLIGFQLTRSLATLEDPAWQGVWCDGIKLCQIEHGADRVATIRGLAVMALAMGGGDSPRSKLVLLMTTSA